MKNKALPIAPLFTAWTEFERDDLKRGPSRYAELLRTLEVKVQLYHLEPYTVTLAAEFATFSPHLNEEERAALTLLILTTLIDLSQGSTRTPTTGPIAFNHIRSIYTTLCGVDAAPLLQISRHFLDQERGQEVIGREEESYKPLLLINGFIYHQRLYQIEQRLAKLIAPRLKSQNGTTDEQDVLNEIMTELKNRPEVSKSGQVITLSNEQEKAVRLALSAPLCLIAGGPGTGKTSILVALLRGLLRKGITSTDIALAAPTGKAAWRIGESIRKGLYSLHNPSTLDQQLCAQIPLPQTLHRLLGFQPINGRYTKHKNAPLDAKVVIIDESSMIDLYLMERLVNALSVHTRLILLGDSDQLPSVSAGAAYRDLLQVGIQQTATLTKSYRMRADNPAGSAILSIARDVCNGKGICTVSYSDHAQLAIHAVNSKLSIVHKVSELIYQGVELLVIQKDQRGLLDEWSKRFVTGNTALMHLQQQTWYFPDGKCIEGDDFKAIDTLFKQSSQAKILCLTHNLETGVSRVNQRLHTRYAHALGQDHQWIRGEPIMMLMNDYDRQLFNGDQGIILHISIGGEPRDMFVFPTNDGGYRAFELDTLIGKVEYSYAMTVHKSQGSEFSHVTVLLPPIHLPLLTQELIYTAMTRSKQSVIFAGDPTLLTIQSMINRPRSSGLVDKITSLVRSS